MIFRKIEQLPVIALEKKKQTGIDVRWGFLPTYGKHFNICWSLGREIEFCLEGLYMFFCIFVLTVVSFLLMVVAVFSFVVSNLKLKEMFSSRQRLFSGHHYKWSVKPENLCSKWAMSQKADDRCPVSFNLAHNLICSYL